MKNPLLYALPVLFIGIPVAGAATTVLVKSVFSAPINWSTGNQGVTSKAFTVLIDGINTTVTLSTATGTLFAGYSDGGGVSTLTNAGIVGITGSPGAVAGIESRTSELLTITLTPVTGSGISYTVNSVRLFGAGANANSPTFAVTDTVGSTVYASAALGGFQDSGLLALASAPTGIDSVSFTVRQTAQTADTTEGGFLSDFNVSAIPEPSAALLGGLGMLALLRRRR